MTNQLTLSEMREKLEKAKECHKPCYEDWLSRNSWILELASAELSRRERAAEEKVACMCGHPRTSHDCHGKCYDIATRGWCSCANFTESPVTDGED